MKLNQFKRWKMAVPVLLLVILCAADGIARDGQSVGKVIAIRGTVLAQGPDLNSRTLFIKAPIFLHDTIKTGQGRVQLMFEDKTLMTLGQDTEMEISQYAWKPDDTQSIMETRIHEGSFRIMGGAITRIAPHNFTTHSSSGTIGIRGSMYAGIKKGPLLTVLFQGGKGIYVKNSAGMVNINRPGFGTRVKSNDQAPEKPVRITSDELIQIEHLLAAAPEKGPAKPNPDPVKKQPAKPVVDLSPKTDDTVLTSAQNSLDNTPQPTSTQIAILSMLSDLGFNGSPSTAIPDDGIWIYRGKADNTLTDEPLEDMKLAVNFHNQRIMVFDDKPDNSSATSNNFGIGFGFGNADKSGSITDFHVLGSGGDENPGIITAMTGSETYGHFYDPNQEGIGLAVEGYDYNIQDLSQKKFWSDIIAATLDKKINTTDSGTETWKGFHVGIAEDMSAPNTNRRVFYNENADHFSFTVDKDNGTVSGTLSGKDFNNAGNLITGLTIGGGTDDSAYIADKILGASISGNNGMTINSMGTGLKPYGNFMVTSRTEMLSNHTTWGYWEIAYEEPGTEKDYHLHIPGARWIAGKQTLSTAVASRIATSFTGIYKGKAEGVMFDNQTQMTDMTNGFTNLNINFTPGATIPVSGNISFDQINLPVTSTTGDISVSGFNAGIAGAVQSSVNGTFFGPTAEALGGNFSARMNNNKQYHGIFAGDLQP